MTDGGMTSLFFFPLLQSVRLKYWQYLPSLFKAVALAPISPYLRNLQPIQRTHQEDLIDSLDLTLVSVSPR